MAERAERLGKLMLTVASHDLRTPLAAIKAASSTLLDAKVELSDADRHELLTLLDQQAARMGRLIESTLKSIRHEAGILGIEPEPIEVGDLIGEAVSWLAPMFLHRTLLCIVPAELPPVEVDRTLITEVIANLVENADRYGPPDTAITIRAIAEGPWVEVSVEDHGPGLPQGKGDRVFDRFVSGAGPGREGLGLAIAKTFVEAHGGRLRADRTHDVGTRLVFDLPQASAASMRAS